MAEATPALPPRPPAAAASGSSYNAAQSAAIKQRLAQRKSSAQDLRSPPPDVNRRRSSILSYSSFEDATNSFADDIISPTSGRRNTTRRDGDDEDTHWHSTPLAFAILPAIAGLLFNNGSAFVTDVLLLALAAVFMNWSIRIPRDWYRSAQAVESVPELDLGSIPEEGEDVDELAVESSSDERGTQKKEARELSQEQEDAEASLRRQEVLALLASFVMPAVAAYLLHVIRAQLSRPSTGLVSDYNLCIFLLAAEFWPCRQVARLLTARTLHLQRTATGLDDPFGANTVDKSSLANLKSRLADLEARLSDHSIVAPGASIAQKAEISDISSELRKRYEPRLEGLERAVRRYEKRTTTLAMATESRLQNLEARLQDALSLAAVAAQHSQHRGPISKTAESVTKLVTFPARVAWTLCMWPVRVMEEMYEKVKVLLLGPSPAKGGKRSGSRYGTNGAMDDRLREKTPMRKAVR